MNKILILTIGLTTLTASLMGGCGKQPSLTLETITQAQAPGHFMVPPKVDILLAEDDTASAALIYSKVAPQVPNFLNNLSGRGWDFHFAIAPLTHSIPMTKVTASRHDSNYGAAWTPPFPGAILGLPGTLSPNVFKPLDQYSVSWAEIIDATNGNEEGFKTINNTLRVKAQGTNFLRSDALLAIVVMSSGNDTSDVVFVPRPGNWPAATADSLTHSFNYYKSQFLGLKASATQVKFFAAVDQCQDQWSIVVGHRYEDMANALGGQSYNLCNQSVSSVLDSLAQNLQITRLALRTRYIFIDKDADVSTIVVTKHSNGVDQVLPMNSTNGWTYAGYVSNVFSIDSPAPMNQASGYAIELHGSAKLIGDDTADINFKAAGFSNTFTK